MSEAEKALQEGGVVDPTAYDRDEVSAAEAAANEAPKTFVVKQQVPDGKGGVKEIDVEVREIVLRVPTSISDQTVQAAWGLGMGAVQNVTQGVMTMIFPHFKPNAEGKLEPMIGRKDVVLAKPEDTARMLRLGDTITQVSIATAKIAATQPANLIAATQNGTVLKDNTTNDLIAQAKGQAGGIIIAKG